MLGITRAPELDRKGLTWFNVSEPLSLERLGGRLVVLDFWTYCCVNCLQVLPTLRRLEEAFPREVAVIGVHSPKFAAEHDAARVAAAIARHDIRHPVVHDPYHVLWDAYAVRAWPTLVFVSPDGLVMEQMAGEPHPDLLVEGIGDMVRDFQQRGEMRPAALPLRHPPAVGGALRFPGKIKPARLGDGRKAWAVADAGHHQIALFDDAGTELMRYGSGHAGFADGDAATAWFHAPQGLVCGDDDIFVADTGNHAVRRIDRASGDVTTLAGTGSRGGALRRPGPARTAALASPWDLERGADLLIVANAGSHQLVAIGLARNELRPLAGSGGEALVDGPAGEAALAQPSGLAWGGDGSLYIADSESSAVRRLVFAPVPRLETVVGHGLFEFGADDGPCAEALLQHPLGLAAAGDRLVVADSYNDALRLIEVSAGRVETLAALACQDLVCRPLAEPAGVAWDPPDRLLVSDTNNHRIVEVDLAAGSMRTWTA